MRFDHVVHFIEETPEQAVTFWSKNMRHPIIGGRHEKWGTRNALWYTRNSYIEWLALENRQIAESAEHPLTQLMLQNGAGFGTVCFRVDSVDKLNVRLLAEGFETSGILAGSRRTSEGKLLEWKMLFINEEFSSRLPNPFFIEWDESDDQRYEALQKSGAIHASDAVREIDRCIFGVDDVKASESRWKKLLGGSLHLPNCTIEFRERTGEKERLEKVRFKGAEKRVRYEKGEYLI